MYYGGKLWKTITRITTGRKLLRTPRGGVGTRDGRRAEAGGSVGGGAFTGMGPVALGWVIFRSNES